MPLAATSLLFSDKVTHLLTLLEEASRSSQEGVRYFVEPAENALRRAINKRHHIVFGRRGSGKTSLLRKAAADLTIDRRPIAWVDLEPFKGHSYPDLLLSILIRTFIEFKTWLETAAIARSNKKSFWARLFGTAPTRPALDKAACTALIRLIDEQLRDLNAQLYATDTAEITVETQTSSSTEQESARGIDGRVDAAATSLGTVGLRASASRRATTTTSDGQTTEEKYRRSKVEFLLRHILQFQNIFRQMAHVSAGDAYLFLDDVYQLRRQDQAKVLDYLHAIAKGNYLWLKIGTVRHRTDIYVPSPQPIGLKLGDDADEIDLDLTLEKYSLTKSFLTKVLSNFVRGVDVASLDDLITDTGLDRLVLASGGVARDFLGVFRRAVNAAKERGGKGIRGPKVGAEDVNVAAGEYDTVKRDDFRNDIYSEEEDSLTSTFGRIREFCLQGIEANCFLIEKMAAGAEVDAIHELVDLKLLHLIDSRVTVNTRQGRLYEAYMLDLSQYAGARKKRDLKMIEFWRPDAKDELRKSSLIFLEDRQQQAGWH